MDGKPDRYYVTIPASRLEGASPRSSTPEFILSFLSVLLGLTPEDVRATGFQVLQNATAVNWALESPAGRASPSQDLVAVIEFRTSNEDFLRRLDSSLRASSIGFGGNPSIGLADYWCPAGAAKDTFGTRSDARRLVRADSHVLAGLTGAKVNVVIVDQGLDWTRISAENFGGSWLPEQDGRRPRERELREDLRHGTMIAHNILDIAPEVKLFDFPLIPPRILNIPKFVAEAQVAFAAMARDIAAINRESPEAEPGRWIVVNAWATFDSRSDTQIVRYTDGANHPFQQVVRRLIAEGVDVVFCAGNCGQFCPDGRCGPNDIGPGRSVLGANSYPEVLSVGAVRVDGVPLGYSSQGPGQLSLSERKPDLVGPSNFHGDSDVGDRNAGTSAACAIATGVLAALRTRWHSGNVTPAEMIDVLTQGAGEQWDRQIGFGILNAENAVDLLQARRPSA